MSRHRHPLLELTRARFLEFVREPEALFWVFGFPVLMTLALGIAFRSREAPPVVVGLVQLEGAVTLRDAMRRAPHLQVLDVSLEAAEAELRHSRIDIIVVPGVPPTYRYDPSKPESRVARLVVDDALQAAAGRQNVWNARDQRVEQAGSRYIDWVLPGLLGMNIMGTGLWGIGFSLVQARTRKLLKRFMATPMRRSDYLMSHVLSRLIFLGLEVAAILGFGVLVFGVPLRGPVWALLVVCLIGALSFGGLGLLLASRPRTIEGVSGLMNLAMLPMWLLSGVFFSSDRFPEAMQPAIRALPLTALNEALRGVMLDGAALSAQWSQVAILTAWGLGCFAVAVKIFRWR
ncbi:MAG: ABC transporter permease [Vicinamibacterales bacterium]